MTTSAEEKKVVAQTRRNIEFILGQILRFAKMPVKERFAYIRAHRIEAFCTLPNPDGRGHIQCGMLAWERFDKLTASTFTFEPSLVGRFDQGRLRKLVEEVFTEMFLKGSLETNNDPAKKFLVSAATKAKAFLGESEHFIPCIWFLHGGPQEFSVGPVRFIRTRAFFREKLAIFKQSAIEQEAKHIGKH